MIAVWDTSKLESDVEQRAAERGKALASAANYRHVQLAREIALELGRSGLAVCADDVRAAMEERYPDAMDGCKNWMGSVFKGDEWAPAGIKRSRTKGSHGHLVRLWVRRVA